MGKIILIASNKGGTGKTTISLNLAVGLSKFGSVGLCDSDIQQSLSDWNSIRIDELGKNKGFEITQQYENISKQVIELSKKYDYLIVDVAGRNSPEFISCLAVCDILISPIQVSQFDLNTLMQLDIQIKELEEINPNLLKNSFVLYNKATTNLFIKNKEEEDLKNFISELDNLKLLSSVVSERKLYKDAVSVGLSVLEFNNKNEKAIQEILNLSKEIGKILSK